MGARGRLNSLALALALLAGAAAHASPTSYTGFVVEAVLFDAPEGVEVDELRYLLALEEGEVYRPADVRRSIELLHGVGLFQEVAATVALDGAKLIVTFHLVPSPTLRDVSFSGLPAPVSRSLARDSLPIRTGDPFFPGDHEQMAEKLEALLADEGYLDARVRAEVVDLSTHHVKVRFTVDAGAPYVVGEVQFNRGAGLEVSRLRRATRAGWQEGHRFRRKRIEDGRDRLERLLRNRLGHLEARLLPPIEDVDSDARTVDVIYNVVPGKQIVIDFLEIRDPRRPEVTRGPPPHREQRLLKELGVEREYNLSSGYLQDAIARVENFYRDLGHFEVTVDGSIEEDDQHKTLRFRVETGPRAVLVSRSDFQIQGNEVVKAKEIRELAASRFRAPLRWPGVTEDALSGLVDDVEDLYESRGYLTAEVSVGDLVREPRGSLPMRTHITMRVAEGPRTTVRDVEVRGNERIAGDEIRALAVPLVDKPMRRPVVETALADVRRLYTNQGYADVVVRAREDFSEDGTEATLIWEINEGPRIQFGTVVVRGNARTRTRLIRNELQINPGRVWRESDLERSKQRLMDTGLFSQVRIRPLNTSERVRDVLVEVAERKRWRLMLGPGISTAEGVRLVVESQVNNIGGVGHRWTSYMHIGIDSESLRLFGPAGGLAHFGDLEAEWKIVTGYEFAHIPRVPLRFNVRLLLNERLTQPTYIVQRYGVGLGAVFRTPLPSGKTHELRVSGGFNVVWRYPEYVDPAAQLCDADIVDQTFESRFLGLIGAPEPPDSLRRLGFLWLAAQIDLRNDTFNPTKGLYATAELELTEPTPISQEKFGRFRSGVTLYLPMKEWLRERLPWWPFDVVTGIEGGVGWAWSDTEMIPVEYRFRLGGATSVRGYALETLGPTQERPRTLSEELFTSDNVSVPVGGDIFYRFTLEEHFPLNRKRSVELILFEDGGNAYLRSGDELEGLDRGFDPVVRWSAGVGLRVRTPIGPLRLDVGFQLGSESPILHPELDAWWKGMNIHFSLGAL